jgi:uncharacterized protein (TIGR02246 family)
MLSREWPYRPARKEEVMWHRFALTLYLVGAIVAPAFGQAAGTAVEQKLRQEIEGVFTGWLEALNKGDGKAAAAFFAPDAPAINPAGVVRGDSQDYVNRIEQQRQRGTRTMATIEQVQAIGSDAAYATGRIRPRSVPTATGRRCKAIGCRCSRAGATPGRSGLRPSRKSDRSRLWANNVPDTGGMPARVAKRAAPRLVASR